MASASTHRHHSSPKSHFQQAVCLADWWLIKAENDFQGNRLAVAGFSSREKQAMRVFSSAPILKRYDMQTLETSDGICVILKGFMNKPRTLENGFPSDACNHFVFGFPPYWKEYKEKLMSKESSSGNSLGVNLDEKLSPQSKAFCAELVPKEGGELDEDSHEDNLGLGDVMNAKDVRKNERTIAWTSDSDNVEMSYSNVEIKTDDIADKEKDVDDSQINFSGSILSQCCLNDRTTIKMAQKVGLCKKNAKDCETSLSEDIIDLTEGRMRTYTRHTSESNRKSKRKAARISGIEMTGLNSLSHLSDEKVESACVDCVPGGRNRRNSEGSGLRKHKVERKWTKSSGGSVKDKFEQSLETPRQNKDQKSVKTKGNKQKVKSKATRSHGAGAAENRKQKVTAEEGSLSENAKASTVKTKRMAYETPSLGVEKASATSTELRRFTRSRSGRLLMPTLEYWRNQRAVYDVDRTVTGIQECLRREEPRKGNRSESLRKRRHIS